MAKKSLAGRIAVVAGATRGAGRGIARGLGEAGATVVCTGRSVEGAPSAYGRPETIGETAAMVTAAGGTGIAIRVDHGVEAEVAALFERIARDYQRLDVLVNSIAGEDPLLGGWTSFWKTDLTQADRAWRQAVLSHMLTAKHAAPLMIRKRRGLIVEVVEGDLLFSSGNVIAQLAKFTLKGFAGTMAAELATHRVAALAITPGYLRSESMLQHFGVTEDTWRDGGKKDPNFLQSESPLFVGRAVAALAADRGILQRTGDVTSSWAVAAEFGLTDADGTRPDWGAHLEQTLLPSMKWYRNGMERHVAWLDRLSQRGKVYLKSA
jgi:NAD(P)-dependent dehydrogenase (short-subunit alcohol dehydrogenase family)